MHPELNYAIAKLRREELIGAPPVPRPGTPGAQARGASSAAAATCSSRWPPNPHHRPPPTSPGGARPRRSRPACRLTGRPPGSRPHAAGSRRRVPVRRIASTV